MLNREGDMEEGIEMLGREGGRGEEGVGRRVCVCVCVGGGWGGGGWLLCTRVAKTLTEFLLL